MISPFFRLGHKTYCVVSVRIQRRPEEVSDAHGLSGEDMEHLAQDSTLEHGETRRRSRHSMPRLDFCCVNNCFHIGLRILMWTKGPWEAYSFLHYGLSRRPVTNRTS